MEKNEITNEELASQIGKLGTMIESVATNLTEFQIETRNNFKENRDRFENLEKGMFTPEEKENILAMSRHYNKSLEDSALGRKGITLTRDEYDTTAKNIGFPNRFDKPNEIVVD